jgi:hypothetical protein
MLPFFVVEDEHCISLALYLFLKPLLNAENKMEAKASPQSVELVWHLASLPKAFVFVLSDRAINDMMFPS